MEEAEPIEQDLHLPFFVHYTSVNAVWAPTDPYGECLLFFLLPPPMITSLLLGLSTPPVSPPWFWDIIFLAPSL